MTSPASISVDPLGNATNFYNRPIVITNAKRVPTVNDIYPAGTQWQYIVSNPAQMYETSGAGNWIAIPSAGTLATLTPNSGTSPVVPTGGTISVLGSGSITAVGGTNTLTVQLTGLTNHALLVGAGTATMTKLAVGATGQGLMGATGADPAWTGSPSYSGSVTAGTTLTATSGAITATNGNLVLNTAGNKIIIATGSNASVGTSAAMSGTPGQVTVATTACSATAKIFFCRETAGGSLGNVSISAQDGTGFTLLSDKNETSTFNWWIINS